MIHRIRLFYLSVLFVPFLLPGIAGAQHHVPTKTTKPAKTTSSGKSKPPSVASFLVKIPGGTFAMGDPTREGGLGERPVHQVTVSDFYISKYEVSFSEFNAFRKSTGRTIPDNARKKSGRKPVASIDWYDAVEYCNWLSVQHKLRPVYTINKTVQDTNNYSGSDPKKWIVTPNWSANGYRLPTEAEWEHAARAVLISGKVQGGGKVLYGNGRDTLLDSEANFRSDVPNKTLLQVFDGSIPVDSLSANPFGLKNMSGNVQEWCWDWFDGDYYQKSDGARDPKGAASGTSRVLRGGTFTSLVWGCRTYCRQFDYPEFIIFTRGFRVARSL